MNELIRIHQMPEVEVVGNLTHYSPDENTGNVRCLNGSAHAWRTTDIKRVTCPLCLDENTNHDFWYYDNGQKRDFKQRGLTFKL